MVCSFGGGAPVRAIDVGGGVHGILVGVFSAKLEGVVLESEPEISNYGEEVAIQKYIRSPECVPIRGWRYVEGLVWVCRNGRDCVQEPVYVVVLECGKRPVFERPRVRCCGKSGGSGGADCSR